MTPYAFTKFLRCDALLTRLLSLLALLAMWAAVALTPHQAHAAAPAGLSIGNQASATYLDASSVTRTVTSNTVLTTVQQVGSVSLAANSTKTISPGGQTYYPHTLVNTGNGTDTFALTSSNSGSFTFASVAFYADVNGDGVPDNAVPITSTGALAMGQTFKFVAAGIVPPTAVAGNTNALVITATSGFAPGTTATVTDTSTVTGQAVIAVTQSLDVTSGPSPSAGRTIVINYTNTGNTTATNLALTEVLPSGMTYVAGSARWSVTGATVLTDADSTDNQSGIVYDYGVTTGGRVTAVIASVAPGASGLVSFQVNINSGLPAGANAATASTARFGYHDGASTVAAANANTVQYTVLSSAAVSLAGTTVATAAQGSTVDFLNIVTNNGNTTDSFDLTVLSSTFPAGTTFQFFQSNGITPLIDSNGNGTPDSGPLAAGASLAFVIKATLPTGSTGGPYVMVDKATSGTDSSKTATATNTLTLITGSTVDLSNDTAGLGSPGYGAGPEASAVQLPAVNPGVTQRFTLVVANNSTTADSYSLQASTDSTFATSALPSGWSVVFKNAAGTVLDSTGVVAANTNKTVYADVSVPLGTPAGAVQLYFRALSPTTGASDRLHDAVVVNLVRGLTLTPNSPGQATAAGTVVYPHILTNVGSTREGDNVLSVGTITVADTLPGFTSVIYWDKNNDGVLDPSDPVITDLASLTGGTNGASTAAGLEPGESVRLFIKVTTPAGAPVGSSDVTTMSVTLTGTVATVVAPPAVVVTDNTTVIASPIVLVIKQSLDADCDGIADNAIYSVATIVSGSKPGACVRYEVTATNAGPVMVSDLVVSTSTPAYTVYTITVPASTTLGSVTAPADGVAGRVSAAIPGLNAGQSVVMRFGVRISP